jgi:hypothetical protein
MSDSESVSAASTVAILGSASSEEPEDNHTSGSPERGGADSAPEVSDDPSEPELSDPEESDGEADFAFVYREPLTQAERNEYQDHQLSAGLALPVERAADGEPLTRHAWVSVVAGARRIRIRGFWKNTCYEEETVNPSYMATVPIFVTIMLRRLWNRASREAEE